MTQASISVARTAYYYLLGQPGPHIRRYWLVCHGYAQLADEFLEWFRTLDDGQTLIVAPEGLNYFYKKGFGGPPGATWMTRQHRETEIADYTAYLQQLHTQILENLPADVAVTLFGFSQGVATVLRWVARCQPHSHRLIAWAGFPPEDLPYADFQSYWTDKPRWFCCGDADPFLTPDRLEALEALLTAHRLTFERLRFQGGHEVPAAALEGLRG